MILFLSVIWLVLCLGHKKTWHEKLWFSVMSCESLNCRLYYYYSSRVGAMGRGCGIQIKVMGCSRLCYRILRFVTFCDLDSIVTLWPWFIYHATVLPDVQAVGWESIRVNFHHVRVTKTWLWYTVLKWRWLWGRAHHPAYQTITIIIMKIDLIF